MPWTRAYAILQDPSSASYSDDWLEPDAVSTVVVEYNRKQFEICFGSINMIKNEKIAYVKHGRVRRYKTSRDLCHPWNVRDTKSI